jgi:hypothetical protein
MWLSIGWTALWLSLACVVGGIAAVRGRSALAWFVIATVASPLIAGLLVTVLPPGMTREENYLSTALLPEPLLPPSQRFQPDGTYGSIPYRVNESGTIDVLMEGKVVRYPDIEQFLMAVRR